MSLLVSFLFAEFLHAMKYSRVIGQIFAGILLGLPFLSSLFTQDVRTDISFLADLGLVFLLLLTGLEINLHKFRKSGKDSLILAIFSALVPFLLGFVFMRAAGFPSTIAVVVGLTLALTAEGTNLKILIDMGVLNTKVGVLILGAGILDDFFEVIGLAVVLILAHHTAQSLIVFPIKFLLFIAIVYLTYKVFPKILALIHKERNRITTFSTMLIFGLIIATLSSMLDLGPIIGAFIAGIIIHLSERNNREHKEHIDELRMMTFSLIIPFFFLNIGLHFSAESLAGNFWISFLLFFIATSGKLLGAMLATPFTKLKLKQTHLIGWGLNSRGAVELVIAELARQAGIIPIEIYSAIIVMAITTTLVFPVIMKRIIRKDPTIMND